MVAATPDEVERFGEQAQRIGRRPVWRSPEDFRSVFNGYELAEPGMVQTARWRPELGEVGVGTPGALAADTWSAVGLLVSRPTPPALRV